MITAMNLICFKLSAFAGPLILLCLLVLIGIAWLFHSAEWKKQEELSKFLEKNSAALIEENIPIDILKPRTESRILGWAECDLFLFPEGLILRGRQNSIGFYECIFLYFKESKHPYFNGFRCVGKYKLPKMTNNSLWYCLSLRERLIVFYFDMYLEFNISPSEKTIEILRQHNLL